MLQKGNAPRITLELQEELNTYLKPAEKWGLINLGKGYFTLKFSCEGDLKKISRFSSYKLSSGVLYRREWKRGFDPYKEQSSVAQVWIRAYHLPAELWHPEVLAAVFQEIGTLVKFDGNTMSGNSRYFARALVEVDLSQPIITSVMERCSDGSLLIDLSYENLPLYCSCCNFVGHDINNCRKQKTADKVVEKGGKTFNLPKQQKEQPAKVKGGSEWIQKGARDGPLETGRRTQSENAGIITTNRFLRIEDINEDATNEVTALEKEDLVDLEGEVQACSEGSDMEMDELALKLAKHSMIKTPKGGSLQGHVERD